ncbi:hydroxyethylthiazole kinase [Anoxynatronum buryatiense]|uniref:Hydroxyethylthiazole kinase n=2 Tax=Anoxynatronum buryatiense TaxID=489973 RepID=A0AA45WXA3_9CLOT|nr:hydroxyethylthiazole kinase [Anoxynatronum buryatiense]SMP61786.1 hydroxyethylthiazole kinase [Anoxynatronum buryatiense]
MKLNGILSETRRKTPLVQVITNYVTINDCANVLLACGASPAMCEVEQEAYAFSKLSAAVYCNIGTLTPEQRLAIKEALRGAAEKEIPVILDPVGCGAIPSRIDYIEELRSQYPIHVVKGNLGEIKSLAGIKTEVRGVDSVDDGKDAVEACVSLARDWQCVVAATGEQDVVTDGTRVAVIQNGTQMLTKITGAGCMAGAVIAGFCGAAASSFEGTVAGLLAISLAGEQAAASADGDLPGTFKVKLIDEIHRLTEEIMTASGKVKWITPSQTDSIQ